MPHRVRPQTELALKLLKTDYIDLLLIHFPVVYSVSTSYKLKKFIGSIN